MSEPVYGRETPVNLRSQRLRRAAGSNQGDADPVEVDAADADTDTAAGPPPADPYGVGQEALAAATQPAPAPAAAVPGLFDEAAPAATAEQARSGWRGRVNAAMGLHLRATPTERDAATSERARRAAIQSSPPGVVVIASPKGGAGKTPTALMLAAAFGSHRRGVVAWDGCESPGTLADRAALRQPGGIADVLVSAGRLASGQAAAAELAAYLTAQPAGHEVLGTALDGSQDPIAVGADECAAVMAVLRRHRDLMVVDTGNNTYAPAWRWAVGHADQLVVPVPLRVDAAKAAYWMLHRLRAEGYEETAAAARVLLVAVPGADGALEQRIAEQLAAAGATRFSRVPYDSLLAAGGRIAFGQTTAATQAAFTDLAARVAGDLAGRASGSVLTGRAPAGGYSSSDGEFPRIVTEGDAW
ncbi:MinD/ParA family ATP-binding protein [Tomitella cavernea]|uniref:MinD/ParA family ATP-binding protein n=1 Tax=Tomitella cavernea TaxID=1387982 RepID=UPI0019054AD9|nr:ParA family protein [Tomitella cavernea]